MSIERKTDSLGPPQTGIFGFKEAVDQNGVPLCLAWTVEDVEDWVADVLNFPQYTECFTKNYINGRKLIYMDASHLPQIGITDFEHIKIITAAIRKQLNIGVEKWNRSITLPPKDTLEHFIERKGFSGKESDSLSFESHLRYLDKFALHGVPQKFNTNDYKFR